MAKDLLTLPPSLTDLAAKNEGVFPVAYVLGVLEGHARRPAFSGAMPEFVEDAHRKSPSVDLEGAKGPVAANVAGIVRYLIEVQD